MNWIAIFVGAVINMLVGMIWYSSMLFGKPWMKMSGKSEMAKGSEMGKMYAVTFIGALVMSYVLMHFIIVSRATSFLWGIKIGFWLWIGFTAATTLSDYLFTNRPLKLYAINVGYYLVVALIVGGLFGVWH